MKFRALSIKGLSTGNTFSGEDVPFIDDYSKEVEPQVLYSLEPGSYKVVLNIDNTEVYGG